MNFNYTGSSLQSILRKADQSCTAHAILRDKYKMRSMLIDCITLFLSTWILTMVFVQPEIAIKLSPSFLSQTIWIGVISFFVFILTIFQLVVDWRGKYQAHHQAAISLSSFVKEFRPIADTTETEAIINALLQYRIITNQMEPIPEKQFLRLKQQHLMKVAISRHLDKAPGTSLVLFRIKAWLNDNCFWCKPSKNE